MLMKKWLSALLLCMVVTLAHAQLCSDMCVAISVSVSSSPKQILLSWPFTATATGYNLYRKTKSAISFGIPRASLPSTSTGFTDTSVAIGTGYEYYVVMANSVAPNAPRSYVYAGIDLPTVTANGALLLLVDSNYMLPLATSIRNLQLSFIADGWKVITVYTGRNEAVTSIKAKILAAQASNPTLNSLVILGHVPVPYSGNQNPDGHPDHLGAWPCDAYYGDTDDPWTDNSVNNATASRPQNQNIPGDGKFDQTYLSSPLELATGRIDLSNLPSFTQSDTALIQQYIQKDLNFKYALFQPRKRMLIDDNFGYFSSEAFAQNGWRNGLCNVSWDSCMAGDYITDMQNDSYLWSYGCGGGTYTSAGGVGSTGSLASGSLHGTFSMLFGSYFGDWDSQDNFLRAPLANAGEVLTNSWAGRPNWFYHYMALGLPIGECVKISQYNNSLYYPQNYAVNNVHTGFMGDVSLRQQYFKVCQNFSVTPVNANQEVQLSWAANTEPGVMGYHIYRSNSINGDFQLLNSNIITANTYTDVQPLSGQNVYMLRAVRMEQSVTGTYKNQCLGIFDSVQNITPSGIHPIAESQTDFTFAPNPIQSKGTLYISYPSDETANLSISNSLGQVILSERIKSSTSLQLPSLSAGIYWLQVDSKTLHSTKKLIVN